MFRRIELLGMTLRTGLIQHPTRPLIAFPGQPVPDRLAPSRWFSTTALPTFTPPPRLPFPWLLSVAPPRRCCHHLGPRRVVAPAFVRYAALSPPRCRPHRVTDPGVPILSAGAHAEPRPVLADTTVSSRRRGYLHCTFSIPFVCFLCLPAFRLPSPSV